MTIKISQLPDIAEISGNTYVPLVSNIAGTLVTVKGNVEQLQTYVLSSISGNVAVLEANVAMLQNEVSALEANVSYVMGNYQHWVSNVTTISQALDQLAERIYNIENP